MNKVNWAIVGLGDIVRKRVGPALMAQPHSHLLACVTRDSKVRTSELAKLQPERVYTHIEEMIADPDVDAVYLATPVFLHAPHAMAALETGKHVLIEKPMALDAKQGEAIRAAAAQRTREVAVAYYRRFWPKFAFVKQILESGELGEVVAIHVACRSWYTPSADDPKGWRVERRKSGGGVLSDIGSHRLDLLAWWFGLPSRIAADIATRTHSYNVEDSAAVLMLFGECIPCTLSCQWNTKTWEDEIKIIGKEASVILAPLDGDELIITRGGESTTRKFPPPSNAHYDLIDDFATAIAAGRAPRFNATDGLAATQIIDAVVASAASQKWVEVR